MTTLRATVEAVVIDPETELPVPLKRNDPFDSESPIAKTYPWAFSSDAARDASNAGGIDPDEVQELRDRLAELEARLDAKSDIEEMTANPGQKRNR